METTTEQVTCPWCPTTFDIDWTQDRPLDTILSHYEFGHGKNFGNPQERITLPAEYKQEEI